MRKPNHYGLERKKERDDRFKECLDYVNRNQGLGFSKGHPTWERARNDLFFYSVVYHGMLNQDTGKYEPFKPKVFQMDLFDEVSKNYSKDKTIVLCVPRQSGKTTAIGIISEWYMMFDKLPTPLENITAVGVVSNSDNQAKKIISKMKNIMRSNSKYLKNLTKGKKEHFYKKHWNYKKTKKDMITFKNESYTESLPPTDSVRGNSYSIGILDEGAFLRDEDFYDKAYEPTTQATKGLNIIASTPDGAGNVFYDLLDIEEEVNDDNTIILWYDEAVYETEDEKSRFEDKKEKAKKQNKLDSFKQEYCADITKSNSSYFNFDKIKEAQKDYEYDKFSKEPTYMGIDWGVVKSETVITITSSNRPKILFQETYSDINISFIEKINRLINNFNTSAVFVDDCPAGQYFNQELKNQHGDIIHPIRFSTVTKEYMFSNAFRLFDESAVVIPKDNKELYKQIINIEKTTTANGNTKITKPRQMNDDRVDSMVLSFYPFYNEDSNYANEPTAFLI